jgi:hypothetical protein
VGVDRARDDLVGPSRLVLVDDRSSLAVVTHPGHQIPEASTAGRSEVVPGVPEIVKVQAFGADRPDGPGPSRHLVEVAAPQRPAFEAGEDERVGLRAGKQRQVLTDGGDPVVSSKVALDFEDAESSRRTSDGAKQPIRVLGGRYELEDILARGSTWEDYRAHDIRLKRPVAVKMLHEDWARDKTFQERLFPNLAGGGRDGR